MSETEDSCIPGREGLAQANNHLAVHLHRLLTEEKGNVFFSPFSVSAAMAMVLCAAEGETESEMRKALGHDYVEMGKDDIISAFQQKMSALTKSTDSYTLTAANSVLSQNGFNVKEEYKSILRESFKALLLEVDFRYETSKVVQQINDWVKEKTNGMIPQLIDSLLPSTVMVLLNAVYFKGGWLRKFDEAMTSPQNFYNRGAEDQAKSVQMMHLKESFAVVEKKSFQALQLPYIGEEIAMLVLLPRDIDGLDALEATLTPSFIQDLSRNMSKRKLKVALPRFRLEYSQSLVSFFQRLGIGKLFSPDAELGGASDSKRLAVSEVFHKAVLEVNEEGSEATAATIIAIRMCASFPAPQFIVDHPFAFIIYEVKTNLILFMGRVNEL